MLHHPTTSHIKRHELIALLQQYYIRIDEWGTHSAKTVDHLLNEINAGESVLKVDAESRTLIRNFSFLAIVVRHGEGDSLYQLIEHKQVFTDGRERVRQSNISVGEKIKHGETNIDDVIRRALHEELGIQEGYHATIHAPVLEQEDSQSYPGIISHRHRHDVVVTIEASQYVPEGYTEVQEDKTTYFVWKKVV